AGRKSAAPGAGADNTGDRVEYSGAGAEDSTDGGRCEPKLRSSDDQTDGAGGAAACVRGAGAVVQDDQHDAGQPDQHFVRRTGEADCERAGLDGSGTL